MALDWVKVEVPLGAGGLAESTDPHHLPPARLVRAENVEITQAGRFDKRRGVVSRQVQGVDTLISTPSQLIEVREDDEAYTQDGRHVGRIPRMHVETSHVTSRQDIDVRTFDAAYYEDDAVRRVLYAYEIGAPLGLSEGVAVSVKDMVNGGWVTRDLIVEPSGGQWVRAITVGDKFLVFWVEEDPDSQYMALRMWRLDAVSLTPSPAVTLVSDVREIVIHGAVYDVAAIDEEHFVLAYVSEDTGPRVMKWRSDGTPLGGGNIPFAGGNAGIRSVAVSCRNQGIAIAWDADDAQGYDGIYTACLDATTWSWTLSDTKVGDVASVPDLSVYACHRITTAWVSDTRWFVAWTTTDYPKDSGDRVYREPILRTHTRAVTTSGAIDPEQTLLHWILVSKAWLLDGRVYALLSLVRRADYDTDRVGDESCLALVHLRRDGEPLLDALFARDVGTYRDSVAPSAGGITAFMPSAAIIADGDPVRAAAHVPYIARRVPFDWVTVGSGLAAFYRFVHWLEAVEVRRLKRTETGPGWLPQGDTVSGVTYTAGALPMQWDTARFVEHNFSARPLILAPPSGGGPVLDSGGLKKGRYTYRAVYTWRNAQGQTEFSATSLPFTVDVPDDGKKVRLHLRSLSLTYKSGFAAQAFGGSTVTIAVYRTFADDASGVYRLVSMPLTFDSSWDNRTIRNSPSTAFHVFTDTLSDDQIANNPILYVSGDVLENEHVGPVSQIVTAKGRLWAIEEGGRAVLYSKPLERHEVAGFSSAQRIPVETDEPLTAIGALDDRIVVFTPRRAFVIFGDGPNKAGQGGFFTEPLEVTVPAGCIGPTAITRTPVGLVYVGHDGVYRMGPGGQVQEIGRDVAGTMREHGPFLVAVHLPKKRQVRLFNVSGTHALVWDYEHGGVWTVHTYGVTRTLAPVSLPTGDRFAAIAEPGVMVEEDENTCLDDGEWVKATLETGHIQLDGIQGYQRVRDVSLLLSGRTAEGYSIKVSLAADDGDWYGTATLDASDIETSRGVQGRVTVARQLCRSIRVKIEDEGDQVTTDAEPRFLGLAFQVGLVRGVTRLGTSATRGVS